ncbi:hypothetical protein BCR34DRAFT_661466 [Clohesyomyces aquaticus]|uniref:Uncharacterized protein n=1 Tax=Clohesyomyces aquaticus TaxID=1231657 RepID=A0A1Y2A1J0_9PLEO|nr:hypothetical protein BCR34DRAFT_661466 [Clohesyomyces aquaticus]
MVKDNIPTKPPKKIPSYAQPTAPSRRKIQEKLSEEVEKPAISGATSRSSSSSFSGPTKTVSSPVSSRPIKSQQKKTSSFTQSVPTKPSITSATKSKLIVDMLASKGRDSVPSQPRSSIMSHTKCTATSVRPIGPLTKYHSQAQRIQLKPKAGSGKVSHETGKSLSKSSLSTLKVTEIPVAKVESTTAAAKEGGAQSSSSSPSTSSRSASPTSPSSFSTSHDGIYTELGASVPSTLQHELRNTFLGFISLQRFLGALETSANGTTRNNIIKDFSKLTASASACQLVEVLKDGAIFRVSDENTGDGITAERQNVLKMWHASLSDLLDDI